MYLHMIQMKDWMEQNNLIYLLLATVLIECIKLSTCALAEGCSPKPCMEGLLALHPTKEFACYLMSVFLFHALPFAKNRSSCRIQIALIHSKEASNKFHKVNAILLHCA